ncbi:hypothetical protein, partial [Aquipuribacter sp. SD81]|uniref:hypothetical protein n=1 Tax=Aquipuribacter sp. SD81 TaxID=3127703 RepID=UPI0030183DF5
MVPRAVPTLVAATGLALLVAGLVMLTLARPPQVVGGEAAGGYVTTGPGVLALTGEPVRVEAVGAAAPGVTPGVYVGRSADVAAWLQGTARTVVTGVADAQTLSAGTEGGDADAPDPARAGVWQQRATGPGAALVVPEPGPDDVVVVAGQGARLEWDRPARHPGAWPLLVGGALTLLLGLRWLTVLAARRARLRRRRSRPRAAGPARAAR